MLSEELKYPSNYTPEVQNATAELYKGVEKVIPAVEWPFHAPLIHEINKLKKENFIISSQCKPYFFLLTTKILDSLGILMYMSFANGLVITEKLQSTYLCK